MPSNLYSILCGLIFNIYLCSCDIITPNVTNSTGHYYYIIIDLSVDASSGGSDHSDTSFISTIDYPLINCTSDIFCYVRCDGDSACDEYTMISTTTPKIEINCIGLHSCHKSTMKLNHISKITLNCLQTDSCSNSIIYTQSSEDVNILCQGCDESVFYLTDTDQQTGEIHMECQSCLKTEIYANKGNIELFYITCSGTSNQCSSTELYCPYSKNNICKISCPSSDGSCGSNFEIVIPYIATNIEFLQLIDYKYNGNEEEKSINVYCNSNTAKFSSTHIVNDSFTKHIECNNITSECCPFTSHRISFDCASLAVTDGICRINCSRANCVNHDIKSTAKTVTELEIICGSNDCYNTIINCPTTQDSFCNITCDYQSSSCHKTVIKYNENNHDINLQCNKDKSCYGLQLYATINDNSNDKLMNANIRCTNIFACSDATLIFHNNFDMINIVCMSQNSDHMAMCYDTRIHFYSSLINKARVNCTGYNDYSTCSQMVINSALVKDFSLICYRDDSCKDIDLYPRIDQVNSTYILCNSRGDCDNINIQLPSTYYVPDYLTTGPSRDCSAITTVCGIAGYSTNLKQDCSCGQYGFMCCPFIYNLTKYNCGVDECIINCDDIHCNRLIINATESKSVRFNCNGEDVTNTKCTMVKLYADTVTDVNINCTYCNNISIFAGHSDKFNMDCHNCMRIVIDVNQAGIVDINAKSFEESIVYAPNTSEFILNCYPMDVESSCSSLQLYVPSTKTSINCEEYSCSSDIKIFSFNGMASLTDTSLLTCGNCFSYDSCIQNWEIYCGEEYTQHTTFYGGNCSDNNEYCNCQQFFDNHYDHVIDGYDTCSDLPQYEPFIPLVIGFAFAIILFAIIAFFLYRVCRAYICQCIDENFKEHESVHPPPRYMLVYLHSWDVFLWIIQWFVVIRIIVFYDHWQELCSSYYQPRDMDGVKQLCDSNFHCSFTINCNASHSLFIMYVFMLSCISIAMFLEFCRAMTILSVGLYENMQLTEFRVRLCSNSVFLRLLSMPKWKDRYWMSIIHEYFYLRLMFGFRVHEDSLLIVYYIIRYLAFYGGALAFYGIWYGETASLHWYEVIPTIIVWLFNEALLIPQYKLMPPYDEHKHCVFIICQICGEDKVANVIMDYVGINYEAGDDDDKKRKKKKKDNNNKRYDSINLSDGEEEMQEIEKQHLRDDSSDSSD